LCRAELDKRRVEKQRLEEEGRKENMVKFRKDAEKSSGETVVLSTGLKEKGGGSKTMMDEERKMKMTMVDSLKMKIL